ncbi:MAG: alpha/beta hydrolase [Verrucomicrobiales bacterium]
MKKFVIRYPLNLILVAVSGAACLLNTIASAQSFALTLRWNEPGAADPLEGSWPTMTGQQYFIETSRDLAQWSLLPFMETGNGTPVSRPLPSDGSGGFFRAWRLPPPPANRPWVTAAASGTLVRFHLFRSVIIGRPVSFHAMMPPSYDADPARRYPVLYWLHGSDGSDPTTLPNLGQFYQNGMVNGQMPHAIVIMANGLPNSMWCNSKDGTNPVESMIIGELIPHVDRTFRTIASRAGRIVEGFSMGGQGAGRFGLKYSDLFRACSLLGAGPLQEPDFLENDPNLAPIASRQQLFAAVYSSDNDYYLAQHPRTWATARAGQLPSDHRIRIKVGAADSLRDNNRKLRDHLVALGVAHSYLELPNVGHTAMQTLSGGTNQWQFYQDTLSATGP